MCAHSYVHTYTEHTHNMCICDVSVWVKLIQWKSMFFINFVLFQGAVIFYLHILRNDRVKAV